LLPLGLELDSAAALLSPRGPVSENGQPRFFRRLAEGIFDLEDLKRRTDDLADFLLAAAQRYQFDLAKLVAVGYSNGANIAASILLRRPAVLRAAILLRAMVPFEPEQLPDLRGVRVWLAGGNEDLIIPRENTERLGEILSDAGAEVTARFFDAGHELTRGEVVPTRHWLAGLSGHSL
jgi:phospholipase/carboxylesterase